MPLLIVVALLLIGGLIWRARTSRRLTMEESVDNYRRTLSAVHDAAIRTRPDADGEPSSRRLPLRPSAPRRPASRRTLTLTILAAVTVVAVVVVVAANQGKTGSDRVAGATTTRPPATRPATTTSTTRPAPTTTAPPLLRATDASRTTFVISKPSFTLAVQIAGSACWVDMRDPAGKSLFAGTVSAGASQSVSAADVTLHLGNPAAATVTVDGTPVPFALASGSPLTSHFQGSAS